MAGVQALNLLQRPPRLIRPVGDPGQPKPGRLIGWVISEDTPQQLIRLLPPARSRRLNGGFKCTPSILVTLVSLFTKRHHVYLTSNLLNILFHVMFNYNTLMGWLQMV
jgi:hypothetical protein